MSEALEHFGEIVAGFNRAIRRRDWSAMRSTLHDDALVVSVSAQATLGPDDLVTWLQKANRNVYDIEPWTVEALDDRSVLASGHARFTTAPQHTSDSAYLWLLTGLENKIWRLKPFASRTEALDQLEAVGHSLGL